MINNGLFSKEDVLRIKENNDCELRDYVNTVLEDAKKCIENTDNRNGDVEKLGFAYFWTGDEAYCKKAVEVMDNSVNNKLWISNEYDPKAYGGYDIRTALETGDRCKEMATAMSLFGNLIPEDKRDEYTKATYEKGILPILEDWVLPDTKIHALDTMGHNFWVTILCGCASAIAVMKDHIPNSEYLLEAAVKGIKEWFEYPGNVLNAKPMTMDRGAYYEGMGYMDYSVHEYVDFAMIYKKILGKAPFDDSQYMKDIGEFYVKMIYPSTKHEYYPGFGDGGKDTYRFAPLRLIKYGMGTPELRWIFRNAIRKTEDEMNRILAWKEIHEEPVTVPRKLSECYDGIGWAEFKDSYDMNSNMLAIKCGDTWNHAHADAASFILFRKGRPEIYDSMTAGSYSRKTYIGYYVQSEAHNVLLFEGKGQDMRDNYKNHAHLPGKLYNYTDDDGFRYLVADGTGPMSRYFRKHHRHFLWLDGFIIVYDDVECYEEGEVNFLLHAKEGHCFTMLTPCEKVMKDGYIDKSDVFNDKYASYNRRTDSEGHVQFLGIMVLDESKTPIFEELPDGFKVTCGDTKVYVNLRSTGKIMHRNCINTLEGIVTDAMLVVQKGDRFGAVNGSIVRKDGHSYLDTLSRITGWTDKF